MITLTAQDFRGDVRKHFLVRRAAVVDTTAIGGASIELRVLLIMVLLAWG